MSYIPMSFLDNYQGYIMDIPRVLLMKNSKAYLFVLHSQNYAARALPILFNTPQKSLLKSSYPKKILAKFSYPKKSQNRKFQTPKNPLIIPVT